MTLICTSLVVVRKVGSCARAAASSKNKSALREPKLRLRTATPEGRSLFITQRLHRVDSRNADSGDANRARSNHQEQSRRGDKDERVRTAETGDDVCSRSAQKRQSNRDA